MHLTEEELQQRIREWIESNVGAKVTSIARQARWRPAWFVELDGAARPRQLYFRGSRGAGHPIFTLDHEAAVLRVLEEEGIPVPHVYGICPEPHGIVMDCAPGQADLSTAKDEAEMAGVLDHYIDILTDMHAIPPERFRSTGLATPGTPESIALGLFERFEKLYRAMKSKPDPMVDFGIAWVRRNVPADRKRVTFVCGDSGQFLFAEGRVTAILDLELAYLGDPAHDLANLRMRDMSEPLGDLGRAFRRYARRAGRPLDTKAIEFHTVQFGLATPMGLSGLVSRPLPLPDLLMHFEWYHQVALMALEAIGFQLGIHFDDVVLPEPQPLRHADLGHALGATVRGLPASTDHEVYAREQVARGVEYLHRIAVHGPSVDRVDIDEAADLVGSPLETVEEADRALAALVAADDGGRDEALVRLFHRRCMRQLRILEPLQCRPGGEIHHLVPAAELLGE